MYIRRSYIENKANIRQAYIWSRYVNLIITIKRQPTRTQLVNSALWLTPRLVVIVPVNPRISFCDKTSTLAVHALWGVHLVPDQREEGNEGAEALSGLTE